MTNTLHRYGPAPSFQDDYVVFAICSRGKNDKDALPKLRQFLQMAIPFKPVNLGDARHGGCLRPSNQMSPLNHWQRDMTPDLEEVVRGFDAPTTVAAKKDLRNMVVLPFAPTSGVSNLCEVEPGKPVVMTYRL